MKKIIIILSIAFTFSLPLSAQKQRVLFIMSAADTLGLNKGKKFQTGVFLNEFYLAYKAIAEAGYDIAFATPGGIASTIDQGSKDDKYWKEKLELKKEALEFVRRNPKFNHPITLEKAMANQAGYLGLVIPGGQGLMVDLLYDSHIPEILTSFHQEGKVIGLICHAPALLLTIPKENNPFKGYQVNSVTGFEEFYIEKFVLKGKPKRRKIAKQLKKAGYQYQRGGQGKNFAIRDRGLITSQNPYSSEAFQKLYLEGLEAYKNR
jgi:putative intracellular protease/amidase